LARVREAPAAAHQVVPVAERVEAVVVVAVADRAIAATRRINGRVA
jgi:hypothetical protein